MAKYQRHKIKYCPICGYVDLTEKEDSCSHCNSSLSITNEYFDEVCSQSELTDKNDIEEYVRQLYVYVNDEFDEDAMSVRENAKNVSDQIDYYEDLILKDNDEDDCKCPECGSTKLSKVSTISKVGSVALFGIFSIGKISKQWHCNSCGSDF